MSAQHRIDGGSSTYYDLPRGPNGEWPKTIHEVIIWWNNGKGMGWAQANVTKAMIRMGQKNDPLYEWEKTKWFTDDQLRRLYASDPENPRHESV